MKTKFAVIALGIALTGVAQGAGQPVPHTFQSGQKAVASEVNANFQELADRIAAGGEVEDASTYQGSGSGSMTFQVIDVAGGCATFETHSFVTSGTTLTRTVVGTAGLGGSFCYKWIDTHQIDANGSRETQSQSYDPGDNVISTTVYTPGWLWLPAQVHVGKSWAIDTDIASTPTGGLTATTIALGQYTIVAKEDVTVPAGSYTNCLKIVRTTAGGHTRIDWRCPGLGLTKRRDSNGSTYGVTRVLYSVSP